MLLVECYGPGSNGLGVGLGAIAYIQSELECNIERSEEGKMCLKTPLLVNNNLSNVVVVNLPVLWHYHG